MNSPYSSENETEYKPYSKRLRKRKNTSLMSPRKTTTRTPNSSPKRKSRKKQLPTLPDFNYDTSKLEEISDLVKIAEMWRDHKVMYNIDDILLEYIDHDFVKEYYNKYITYERLLWIIEELREFDSLIGLGDLKVSLVDQIIFFVQNLQSGELMHTVLYGEQGCGKTTIGNILAKMYSNLGILSEGTFTVARRSDFIAGYLGQTAIKTKKLLDSCMGGVLFIDEAYSLGPSDGDSDSFSKEAIDTLNQFLSENYENFICIIAGYEKNLNDNFFSKNPGLDRRFPWKFKINKYSDKELFNIFKNNFSGNWKCNVSDECLKYFKTSEFSNNGGDCKIIFDRSKIYHGRRMFRDISSEKFVINDSDVKNAIKDFMKSKTKKSSTPNGLYI